MGFVVVRSEDGQKKKGEGKSVVVVPNFVLFFCSSKETKKKGEVRPTRANTVPTLRRRRTTIIKDGDGETHATTRAQKKPWLLKKGLEKKFRKRLRNLTPTPFAPKNEKKEAAERKKGKRENKSH